eukprot:2132002-Lingulodinium_polyedra.AAC.1
MESTFLPEIKSRLPDSVARLITRTKICGRLCYAVDLYADNYDNLKLIYSALRSGLDTNPVIINNRPVLATYQASGQRRAQITLLSAARAA